MNTRRSPLFLERENYRRRRLMDGARVLPVLGFVLILLPVLWTQGGQMGTAGEAVYLFLLWLGLIIAAALLARPLRAAMSREAPRQSDAVRQSAAPESNPSPSETPDSDAPE
jgi:peptidoglycan/LPS O-acetylase OafA/YrhL